MAETETNNSVALAENWLSPMQQRREKAREAWKAWWKIRDLETRGTSYTRVIYLMRRAVDAPVTLWRERVVEPLHNKYKRPYYQRKFSRGPYIDECGINDLVCLYEANEQYRLDKQVDCNIVDLLSQRVKFCKHVHKKDNDLRNCAEAMDEYEKAELNFFIKYGELGMNSDVRDCYMKQKHRMIWERRHPEVMQARRQQEEEHDRKLEKGIYDHWKKGLYFQDKRNFPEPYDELQRDKNVWEGDRAVSKDWQYYKQKKQDPEFDKDAPKQYPARWY